jgi:hypothetical protein
MNRLCDLKKVIDLISERKLLILAGPSHLLKELPSGNYIGGSCYYFINNDKGIEVHDKIAVYDVTEIAKDYKISIYNKNTLKNIYKDAFKHGFSYIIVPFRGATHLELGIALPDYTDFATKPLYGFVSGVIWESIEKERATTFCGLNSHVSVDDAVVLHVELPKDKYAEIDIIDPFEPDKLLECKFNDTGFIVKEVCVNGHWQNFVGFLKETKKDLRYPLICTDFGAKVNVSFVAIQNDSVIMGSPVFKGATYYFTKPVENYASLFKDERKLAPLFSCNCVLNYQYMDLNNKTIYNHLNGPTTFGEIAYRLLNQTIANLYIKEYD